MEKPKDLDHEYDKYLDYLQSDRWAVVRNERLIKDNFRCAVCGSPEQLHVHHIFYPAEYGTETINDLITLCPICHGLVEKLKKEGRHCSKWQKYDFSMTVTVYAEQADIYDFMKRKLLPFGKIAVFYEDPTKSDGDFIKQTNLYGVRILQDVFGDNVFIYIGGH